VRAAASRRIGYFSDGTQRSVYMPTETWNGLVNQANGLQTVTIGPSPSSGTHTLTLPTAGSDDLAFPGVRIGSNDIWSSPIP
jgi:hypothetical protein